MDNLINSEKSDPGLETLWSSINAITHHDGDDVALIVTNGSMQAGNGVYSESAWINRWSHESHSMAVQAIESARLTGIARETFQFCDDAGRSSFWDATLTRVNGHDAILVIARDVTAQKLQEEMLRQVAYHDGLTGLLNRDALKKHLGDYITDAVRYNVPFAFLMLDLDNFKLVNDTLGHEAGDVVLIEAAKRLSKTLVDAGICGRLGGDEFAAIVKMPTGKLGVMSVVERVLQVMRDPFSYEGRVLDARASIGVSVFPDHGKTPSELMKNADIALYASKAFGRGGFTFYASAMGSAIRKRLSSIDAVRDAITHYRFETFYQPKIELATKAIVGFEAILRLRSNSGELLPAHVIMQASDDPDVARLIGDCMFDRVIKDLLMWREAGTKIGRIALNASPAEFKSGDFARRLLERISNAALPTDMFEIEVTETVLTGRGTDYVATALQDLADAGLHITLDNFGTGRSSLAQLRRLPFSALKIGGPFIGDGDDETENYPIVRAIIGLADGLGLGVTAVGIQTAAVSDLLHELGCKVGQGDFLAPILSSSDIATSSPSMVDAPKD